MFEATNANRNIFLTGSTGFMGSHFLYDQAGKVNSVHCLVRAKDSVTAQLRMFDAVGSAAASYIKPTPNYKNIKAYVGDIIQPKLGLTDGQLESLSKIPNLEFWHFAASLNYEESKREELEKQNILATQTAISVAQRMGCKVFVYVSTAYTAGQQTGLIPEALHPLTIPFNNEYEKSKCRAEHSVKALCDELKMPFLILRPTIVIGPSTTKKSGGSNTGMYGFIRAFHRLKRVIDKSPNRLSMRGKPDMQMDYVNIDSVINDINFIIEKNGGPSQIYHLTATDRITVGESVGLCHEMVGITNLDILENVPKDRAPIEKMIDAGAAFYTPYISYPKTFSRSIPYKSGVKSKEDLRGYLVECFKEIHRETVDDVLTRGTLMTDDGVELSTFASINPGKPNLVLVNAYAMPIDFWLPLVKLLKDDFSLFTWESRGLSSSDSKLHAMDVSPPRHVSDLRQIVSHFKIENPMIIGWCTGATIGLQYASKFSVPGVFILNGAFNNLIDEERTTSADQKMRILMSQIAKDPSYADLYFEMLFSKNNTNSKVRDQISQAVSIVSPELAHLTSFPFRSPRNLKTYATMLDHFYRDESHLEFTKVDAPARFFVSLKDIPENQASASKLAMRLPKSTVLTDEDGDHYALFLRPETVAKHIRGFSKQLSRMS